ncbi:sensor histidine kinase [Brevundimonas mediterranea]|uniref:histidine kinase n=1 Tax=Brevundimonas mediterranea TaxID=74329 RepID=A0A7W6A5Y0_9CAUL|nr:histidine kinase dimerization/phosphoacceptor domain -containing protein [Brevundimonas mediterranea]MBB3872315.1 two-component sensor histidine kinase [Brevundimonas mediterranea]
MAPASQDTDIGSALALAVISVSSAPLLLMDEAFDIVAASQSFLMEFGLDGDAVVGRSIFDLGGGEWNLPRLRSLLGAVGSGGAEVPDYQLDMPFRTAATRSLKLNAKRLVFSDTQPVRLLLTIVDVTADKAAQRKMDDLVRQKEVLLQEVQHRVANSLQIIASVLLQTARKTESIESRAHLTEAHNRVMSVAEVQRQLSLNQVDKVALKPYLAQLCGSIGASMIADHDLVRIEVSGDASALDAEVSVSLGLIVTELVINALKHAFPNGRKGVVSVDFQSLSKDWDLTISDDGVGMPKNPDDSEAGLGTAIVKALASQLDATITVKDLDPGTEVSVLHRKTDEETAAAPTV